MIFFLTCNIFPDRKKYFAKITREVEKNRSLLGIKGYYTNISEQTANADIIAQYHNLWKIEKAFRISKNDLEIRPIYHFKEHSIKVHVLICFMALAVCKYMEVQTGQSTEQLVRSFKSVTDAIIFNTMTNKQIIMRSKISDDLKIILLKLDLPY